MNPILTASLSLIPFAAALTAQQPQQPPADLLAALRAPIHDEPGPDGTGTWTAGRDWKASLHAGMTFYPRPAAKNGALQGLRWRTTAVTAAGNPLPLERAAAKVVGPYRCEYDLGDVTEAYDVRAEGLEQTFVLERPLAGDVAIVGTVDGPFTAPATRPRHAALQFAAADGTTLTYGAAIAIDGKGRRLPITSQHEHGRVVLTVPGSWLADAAFPVVVDPLLSSVHIDGSTNEELTRVAVERDDRNSTSNLGVAFERQFGGDTDVWMILANDHWLGATVVFSAIGSQPSSRPQLAYLADPNTWILAWNGYSYQYFREACFFHPHTGGVTQPGNLVQSIPDLGNRRARNVVVGGARSNTSSALQALFAWQTEPVGTQGESAGTQVHCALWHAVANAFTPTVTVAGAGSPFPGDCGLPAVSKDRGTGSWMLAWQQLVGFQPMHWDVVAQRVAANGTVSAAAFQTDRIGLAEHQMAPQIDGRHGRYLIAFATTPVTNTLPADEPGQNLRAQRFDWPEGSAVPLAASPSRAFGGANYPAYRADSVAFDSTHGRFWAVGFLNIVFTTPVSSLLILGDDANRREYYALGSPGNAAAAVWDDDNLRFAIGHGLTQNGYSQLTGTHFQFPVPVPPTAYGSSCSPAANSAYGSFLAGDPDQFLRLTNAPGSTLAFLALSFGAADVSLASLGFPGCNLLVDSNEPAWLGAVGLVTTPQGVAELNLPFPGNLPDLDVHSQWFHLDATGQTIQSTRGLHFQVR